VTADSKTRPENTPNPPFTATFSAFQPGRQRVEPRRRAGIRDSRNARFVGGSLPDHAIGRDFDELFDQLRRRRAHRDCGEYSGAAHHDSAGCTGSHCQHDHAARDAAHSSRAPSTVDVLNTLPPTAGADGATVIEQISPTISVVNCGMQSPARGCGPR
jgi:hypothetical protein